MRRIIRYGILKREVVFFFFSLWSIGSLVHLLVCSSWAEYHRCLWYGGGGGLRTGTVPHSSA